MSTLSVGALLTIVTASPAMAASASNPSATTNAIQARVASANVACPSTDLCLYWGPSLTGAYFVPAWHQHGTPDLTNYTYYGGGSGNGQYVGGNEESVYNHTSYTCTVWTGKNYAGSALTLTAGSIAYGLPFPFNLNIWSAYCY